MYIPHVPPYHTLLPILPYTILPSRLYPKSIPSYPPHTFNTPRFPSIYILFHSTLSYSSVPYPKLLHPTPTETRPKLEFVFYVKTDVPPPLEWCSFVQKVRLWYSKGVYTHQVSEVHKRVKYMKCRTCIFNGVKNM